MTDTASDEPTSILGTSPWRIRIVVALIALLSLGLLSLGTVLDRGRRRVT